jgi:hypothetical protein
MHRTELAAPAGRWIAPLEPFIDLHEFAAGTHAN